MIAIARSAAAAVTGAAVAVLVLAGCSSATGDRTTASSHDRPPFRSPGVAPIAAARPAATGSPAATPSAVAPVTPCAAAKARRVVIVSVHAQHLWMCDRHRSVRDTPVTTGAVDLPYDATPTGTFHIQSRNRRTTLTLASGAQYEVRYWIPFDAPLFGFHDSPWQHMPYGSQRYRTKGSHGCVHVPRAALKFLYGWADVGTTVSIRR